MKVLLGINQPVFSLHCYTVVCEENITATLWVFHTEYWLWPYDWLQLLNDWPPKTAVLFSVYCGPLMISSCSLHLHPSLNCGGCWGTTDDYGFHHMVSRGQGTVWWSPSLSRSNTWPLKSSWNHSIHLTLVFKLWRHPLSDAVLRPATGRLVEGRDIFANTGPKDRPLPRCHQQLSTNNDQLIPCFDVQPSMAHL